MSFSTALSIPVNLISVSLIDREGPGLISIRSSRSGDRGGTLKSLSPEKDRVHAI